MTGMVQIPAVSAPDNLAVSEVESTAELSWNDNSDNEIGFSIERSENGGAYMAIDSVSAGGNSFRRYQFNDWGGLCLPCSGLQ